MGRVISQEKLVLMADARAKDPEALGPQLGAFVVNDGVPVESISKILNVAEPTVYRWMFMQATPRDKDKVAKIKRLLVTLRKAKRAKALPLAGNMKARHAAMISILEEYKPVARAE
ncbi:MAG: hypothetical protein ACKO0Z_00185 [Betaproteobacteria bacterium]